MAFPAQRSDQEDFSTIQRDCIGASLKGNWQNGLFRGQAYLSHLAPDGERYMYSGQMENSMREGIGRETLLDSSEYQGEWHKNNRHGSGKIYSLEPHRTLVFEGQWRDGEMMVVDQSK